LKDVRVRVRVKAGVFYHITAAEGEGGIFVYF